MKKESTIMTPNSFRLMILPDGSLKRIETIKDILEGCEEADSYIKENLNPYRPTSSCEY